jgi:hypothetical protein
VNERTFRRNVLLVIGVYGVAIAVGIGFKLLDPTNKDAPVYTTFKDMVPLIIAIPAAWLGYCFQRRQAYLKDVRELWSKLVMAVQDSVQYTHLRAPEQADYARVLKSLSITTEELRAVFVNVGEAEGKAGLFPFESIKDIHGKISALGFAGQFRGEEAAKARGEIVDLWKRLRSHFLSELERGLPARADSPFLQ